MRNIIIGIVTLVSTSAFAKDSITLRNNESVIMSDTRVSCEVKKKVFNKVGPSGYRTNYGGGCDYDNEFIVRSLETMRDSLTEELRTQCIEEGFSCYVINSGIKLVKNNGVGCFPYASVIGLDLKN